MVRRDVARAACDVLDAEGSLALAPAPGAIRLIVALAEGITVRCAGQTEELGRWDTACIDATSAPAAETLCQAAGSAVLFNAVVTPRRS
jgi:hypothetical protein